VTHCLLTVLVLLVGASVVRRGRTVLAALAAGVALHLLRDLGTGPGVPLLWPVSGASVLVPHSCYLGVLAVAVGTAAWWRWDAGQRRPSPSTAGQGRR
jgi:inner membrane protein